MTISEILAHNAGVAAVAALAAASADAMRLRLVQRPTRYAFAIAALEAIVEGSAELLLPVPPDGGEPGAAILLPPGPTTGNGAAAAAEANAR